MKIFLILNMILNLNFSLISNINNELYAYQEMKEIRYIYFYNLEEFNINDIKIYAGFNEVKFKYQYDNFYTLNLDNYYPLDCIKIYSNNKNFSIKINDIDDFYADSFAHFDVYYEKIITIDNLIIDSPKWKEIKYSKYKINSSKTTKLIEN